MPDLGPSPRHLALVGLMGSGKTTVGKKVAKLLGLRFVDADVELERRSERSVADWFATEGEAAFRAAEASLLAAVLDADPEVVYATGGGAVTSSSCRDRLARPDTFVVYLHGDPAFLASRAKAKPHRPLLAGDPSEVLATMYAERDGWYREVADAVVEVQPAHVAGDKPKWRLAEQVAEAAAAHGMAVPHEGAEVAR